MTSVSESEFTRFSSISKGHPLTQNLFLSSLFSVFSFCFNFLLSSLFLPTICLVHHHRPWAVHFLFLLTSQITVTLLYAGHRRDRQPYDRGHHDAHGSVFECPRKVSQLRNRKFGPCLNLNISVFEIELKYIKTLMWCIIEPLTIEVLLLNFLSFILCFVKACVAHTELKYSPRRPHP
jgi:hypothetical protein